MPCTEENLFVPNVPDIKVDLIYLCSPNNPTGAVMTHNDLDKFVDYARENKAVIIFDAAYSAFISDPLLPKSIYEVDGAEECAIEINSFSKSAGFTGVRLGWTVVPKSLVVESTKKGEITKEGEINEAWSRRQCTFFNGASNIVQEGGLYALDNLIACKENIDGYMKNARTIREGVESIGLTAFAGVNAPYVWLKTPGKMTSWDFFYKLLEEAHVVGTPGSGFGPSGKGYFRLSSFGHRKDVKVAVESIQKNLKL